LVNPNVITLYWYNGFPESLKLSYPENLAPKRSANRHLSDLKDAFWKIPLEPSSRDKTAFTIPGKPLYQNRVMHFGLINASQTMTRLMDKVIPPDLRNEVFVYLDDLLVVSDTIETHMKVLSAVAKQIKIAGLTLNVEKTNSACDR